MSSWIQDYWLLFAVTVAAIVDLLTTISGLRKGFDSTWWVIGAELVLALTGLGACFGGDPHNYWWLPMATLFGVSAILKLAVTPSLPADRRH